MNPQVPVQERARDVAGGDRPEPDARRPPGARPTTRPLRTAQALPPSLRVRRAVTLLLLTLVAPGSAQVVAGDRRLGRWLLRGWIVLLGTAVALGVLALVSREAVVWLLARAWVLSGLALVCFLLAVVWPVALVDAWRLSRVRLLPINARRWVALLTVTLVVATAVPMLGSGRRIWAAGDLVRDVFGGGGSATAVDGRLNVLLLGGDAGPDRVGLRPDSITVASVDTRTGRSVLFSLPRNLENVPFPEGTPAARALPKGWSCGDSCLLNGLYTWGTQHRELFPGASDPGAEAMKQAVQAVLGLTVNYYVLIDLRGFRSLIDAMGGIRMDVKQRVPIGGGTSPITGWITPGTRRLDGYRALWFARSREGASDYERMARQRCVMTAMLDQLDPTTVLRNFQSIAAAGKQVVSTDVPAGQLSRLLGLAAAARGQKVSSVQFVPPLIKPARPDLGVVRSTVVAALEASRTAPDADGARASSHRSAGASPRGGTPKAAPKPATTPAPASTSGAAASTDDAAGVCAAA